MIESVIAESPARRRSGVGHASRWPRRVTSVKCQTWQKMTITMGWRSPGRAEPSHQSLLAEAIRARTWLTPYLI